MRQRRPSPFPSIGGISLFVLALAGAVLGAVALGLVLNRTPVNGVDGIDGGNGTCALPCVNGTNGINGTNGTNGTSGGAVLSAQYVQSGSQPASVGAAQPFTYTTAVFTTPGITASTAVFNPPFTISGTVFTLVNIGTYEVNFQITFPTDGGIVLYTGATVAGMLPLAYTMVGKASATSQQVSGSAIIHTTTTSSFLAVVAAAGNGAAIQPGPNSSTTNAGATTVSFKQLA